jgi:hypothetical protein
MWLQNHEKTRNIEIMKKWGLQTMIFHGNDQQKTFDEVPIKTGPCQLGKKCTVQNLNIHYLQENYDHLYENSSSPI